MIMKKIFMVTLLLTTINAAVCAQVGIGQGIAIKMARRMKDSLGLSTTEQQQLYIINLQLYNKKNELWSKYSNEDSLFIHTQKIEDTRDSLYKAVLINDKYLLYKQKKRLLISNN